MHFDLINQLPNVASVGQFAASLEAICRSVGMDHYLAVGLSGPRLDEVRFVHQNAPGAVREAVQSLNHWSIARLMQIVKDSNVPVVFGAEAQPGIELTGYTSGVAIKLHARRSAHVMCFASSAAAVPPERVHAVMQCVILTASCSLEALERFHAAECPFSKRELECLTYALQGDTAKTIAARLGLSRRTIEHCLESARKRCNADTSMGAAYLAMNQGWITVQEDGSAVATR